MFDPCNQPCLMGWSLVVVIAAYDILNLKCLWTADLHMASFEALEVNWFRFSIQQKPVKFTSASKPVANIQMVLKLGKESKARCVFS